jgi:hypothetical protein
VLYLSLTMQRPDATHGRLIALVPETLELLWDIDQPHFAGSNLVALPAGGIWWLGPDDQRNADIQAFRYNKAGENLAQFHYDSGTEDSLGFDRRSGAAGPDSSLYIGGFSQVLRVAANGALLWDYPFPTTAIGSTEDGALIATNLRLPEGNTAKFNAAGQMLWQIDQGGCALAFAADQSMWVAGTRITGKNSNWDLRVLHLSDGGQILTADLYDGKYQDRAVDVATDAQGQAFVLASSYVKTGWFGTADRYLILKYNRFGQRIWSQLYGKVGLPEALAVTAESGVFAVGGDGMIAIKD